MKAKDLTGQRFSRLVVLERVESDSCRNTMWRCRCDCGNETVVRAAYLNNGHTTSCGCYHRERVSVRKSPNIKHGESQSRLYKIWCCMKDRCYRPKNTCYKYYGGRGITICDEWRNDFSTFHNWALANGYREDLTIDRKDNDKGYSPENCRWVDRKTQIENRRCSDKSANAG